MHRSGTSALTRIFNLLGADLPKDLISADDTQPKGYWESDDIVTIDNKVLAAAGSYWDDWKPVSHAWLKSPECQYSYGRELTKILERNFENSRLFVIKDPRICRIVPFWLEALRDFKAEVKAIIPIRSPMEVAASLKARDGFSAEKSYLMWLRYMCDAESATRDIPRAFVAFEDVLNSWKEVIASITNRANIALPPRTPLMEVEIEKFIDVGMRHFITAPAAVFPRADISDWVKTAYRAFDLLVKKGENSTSRRQLDRVKNEFDRASLLFGGAVTETEVKLKSREAELTRLSEDINSIRTLSEERGAIAARLADDLAAHQDLLHARTTALEEEKSLRTRLSKEFEQAHLEKDKASIEELNAARSLADVHEQELVKVRSELEINSSSSL